MNQISISYKTKNNLIEALLKQDNVSEVQNSGILKKLSFFNKEYSDVYFHSGTLDEKSKDEILHSKKVVVNSKSLKKEIIRSIPDLESSKLECIYPSVDINYEKPKLIKKKVCDTLDIDSKKRIILFTAKNFKNSGVKEFIETLFTLNEQNVLGLIAGDKRQINALKFQISKFNYSSKLLLVEDYENIDELFLASDIFFLPTYNNYFASNVLKAMYCKNVVFTTANNHASELIDVFSTMENPNDRSASFKIDAVLMEKEEMKKIKKDNRKLAKKFALDINLKRVNEIIDSLNKI
ncbi:glycosyltransferase [Arcobacter roscoffensis]|uniref:Glycosyltransferase n=1 Tax=Arcobacter roscoffensis TaxID=2961520 RepID=A0ABY5E2E3_9BACT|nr:glycosyltransferase [Arcobacter roscoffensis]UTJ05667.1 glycosyltransferase [Arcobacter roscoffensis]